MQMVGVLYIFTPKVNVSLSVPNLYFVYSMQITKTKITQKCHTWRDRTRTGQTTQLTNMICVGCIVCIELWIRNARFKVHSINVVRIQRTYSICHFTEHMEIYQWHKHFFSMYSIKFFLTRGHQCMYNWSYCVFLLNRYKHRRYQRTPDQHSTVSWHPIWNMIKPYRAGTELIQCIWMR